MSHDDVELDYAYLAQNALRGVVRDVLEITVSLGHPPGGHHFYIEFETQAPGVVMSDGLKDQYPERMTIVLQHQFEDLVVHGDHFEVTLHFKGVPDHLVIPYQAITQFADPSVNFALQFPTQDAPASDDPQQDEPAAEDNVEALNTDRLQAPEGGNDQDDDDPDNNGPKGGSADVVSLDRFRKK